MIREITQLLFILGCVKVCPIIGERTQLHQTNDSDDAIHDHNWVLSLTMVRDEPEVVTTTHDTSFQPDRDVVLFMFSQDYPENGYVLKINDSINLRNSGFTPKRITKIIIHGWVDSSNSSWVKDIRKTYLSVGDYNVIAVDWAIASNKDYLTSIRLIHQVGEYVSDFIKYLKSKTNLSLDNVHIVSHSLGVHVAGIVGAFLLGQLGRITALDAARPGFESSIYKSQRYRLDPSDAKFVDSIHTCAGTVGFKSSVGHADFYPNGGISRQPGCPLLLGQYCSHLRSTQYFIESIVDSTEFIAVKCDSWEDFRAGKCKENAISIMGEYILHTAHGKYYLITNDKPPFAKGHFRAESHTA